MAIGMLAEEFVTLLERGDYPAVKYDEKKITISLIIARIQKRLSKTYTRAYQCRISAETTDDQLRAHIAQKPIKELTRQRRYARRKGVCFLILTDGSSVALIRHQMLKRRQQIIKLNRNRHGPGSSDYLTILASVG
jgi:hypothetical protein